MSGGELIPRDDAELMRALEEQERRIREGRLSMCRALAEIKDKRLWAARGYSNFDQYCQAEWKFSKSQAYRLINDAPIVEEIRRRSPIGENGILEHVNESHLRPLHGMKPHSAVKTLAAALESAPLGRDGKPRLTAKHVERVAEKLGWKPRRKYVLERRSENDPEAVVEQLRNRLRAVHKFGMTPAQAARLDGVGAIEHDVVEARAFACELARLMGVDDV